MQIEPNTVNNTLSLIGTVVVAIAATLGIGNLLLAFYNNYVRKKAQLQETHDTNQGKVIEERIIFRQSFIDRLTAVESKLEKTEDKLNSQIAMNAELKSENKALKETNQRQEQEIHDLQGKVSKLEQELAILRGRPLKEEEDC